MSGLDDISLSNDMVHNYQYNKQPINKFRQRLVKTSFALSEFNYRAFKSYIPAIPKDEITVSCIEKNIRTF